MNLADALATMVEERAAGRSCARAIAITVVGTAIGSALAVGAGRLMESLLYGLVSTSFLQIGALVAVLGFALLAAYVPARRAARIDPMAALRESEGYRRRRKHGRYRL